MYENINDTKTNIYRQTNNVDFIDVPRVFLKKNESKMKITEGQSLTIRCKADALPEYTNFTWTKMDQLISALPTLYIDVVSRKDAGRYTCTAMNLIGTGSIETDVVVFCKYL